MDGCSHRKNWIDWLHIHLHFPHSLRSCDAKRVYNIYCTIQLIPSKTVRKPESRESIAWPMKLCNFSVTEFLLRIENKIFIKPIPLCEMRNMWCQSCFFSFTCRMGLCTRTLGAVIAIRCSGWVPSDRYQCEMWMPINTFSWNALIDVAPKSKMSN